MAFRQETLDREVVLSNPIFKLVKLTVTTKSGTGTRYIIEHKGAVAIAALTKENKLLMIRQFRKALDKEVWEIPAGKIDPDEEPCEFISETGLRANWLSVGKRELREETGWQAEDWKPLCSICGSVGYTNEMIEIWTCRCTEMGSTDFDADEDLDLFEIGLDEALAMVKRGDIIDAKTVCAVMMLTGEKA